MMTSITCQNNLRQYQCLMHIEAPNAYSTETNMLKEESSYNKLKLFPLLAIECLEKAYKNISS